MDEYFCAALILFNNEHLFSGLMGTTVRDFYTYNTRKTSCFAENLPTDDQGLLVLLNRLI